ncbi:MAG: hypothetical protein ABI333_00415 [bacterium]
MRRKSALDKTPIAPGPTPERAPLPSARARWLALGIAAIGAILLAVGGSHFFCVPRKKPPKPALERWTVPGATVMLPKWRLVEDRSADLRGGVELAPPGWAGKNGRKVALRWHPHGNSIDEALLLEIFQRDDIVRRDVETLEINDRATSLWYLEQLDGKKGWVYGFWKCAQPDLGYNLTVFLDWPKKRLLGLAKRIIKTFRCRPEAPLPQPDSLGLVFKAPQGYQRTADPNGFAFEGPQKDIYFISRGQRMQPDADAVKKLAEVMVRGLLPKGAKIDPLPAVRADPKQGIVRVLRAQGRDGDGKEQRLLFTHLYCPTAGRFYFAFHVRSPQLSEADHAARLSRLRCP